MNGIKFGKQMQSDALKKLDEEYRRGKYGQKEMVMKSAVLAKLKDFVRQDEEFAQAVVQGGTFEECMKAVAKGVGSSVSDIEAYTKAVRFYFPGAEIKVQMKVNLAPHTNDEYVAEDKADPVPAKPVGVTLCLDDFFG